MENDHLRVMNGEGKNGGITFISVPHTNASTNFFITAFCQVAKKRKMQI